MLPMRVRERLRQLLRRVRSRAVKLLPRYVLMIRPVHVSERVLLFAAVLLTLLVT